ncbi:putative porin, partial [Escherichia coli]|nr:putative porin [Escherichia coli]
HLKEAAKEQQKAVADSLAVARETLKGYREISDSVAQQVRDEVRQEVQKMDIAGLIGERISADFQRLEKSVGNMNINADALDKEISIIRS